MRNPKIQKSRTQEKRGAKRHGVQLHAGSGSGDVRRNDGHNDDELWEWKRTDNKRQITLNADDLEQLGHRADIQGNRACFGFELNGKDYVVLRDGEYCGLADAAR